MAFSEMRTIERPTGERPAGQRRPSGGAWLQDGQSPPTMLGWRFPAEFRIRPAGWPAAEEKPAAAAVPGSRPVLALDAGLGGGVSGDAALPAEAATALAIGEPCQRQSQAAAPEEGRQTSYL